MPDGQNTLSSPEVNLPIQSLCINGGGIRGILPAIVLTKIVELVGAPLDQIFDLFVGTSSGALLIATLLKPDPNNPGKPQYSAEETLELFEQRTSRAFRSPWLWRIKSLFGLTGPKYDAKDYEAALNEFFQDLKLSQLLKPVYFPVAIMPTFASQTYEPFCFSLDTAGNWPVSKVIRAVTAAPTYYPATLVRGKPYVDGGLYCNNPCTKAYIGAKKTFGCGDHQVIVSIGTGQIDYIPPRSVDEMGDIHWLRNYIAGTTTLQVNNACKEAAELLGIQGTVFPIEFRIDNTQSKLDDISPKNLSALKKIAYGWVEENSDYFEAICRHLKVRVHKEKPSLVSSVDNLLNKAPIRSL